MGIEWVPQQRYETRDEMRKDIFEYIELFHRGRHVAVAAGCHEGRDAAHDSQGEHAMKTLAAILVFGALLAPISNAHSQGTHHSFGFNAGSISGFPSGDVFLTGGGSYDPQSGSLQTGGGFRCTKDIDQGPLAGCKAGEGVRWDASEILSSTGFKCTGSAAEPLKTAVTDDQTIVMQADFYRAGDGVDESFTAKMIVSAVDLDPDQPGIQNIWIQGVGCGEATVKFR